MQIVRIIVATTLFGWLSWFLGKTVINGILSGEIRHTDSTKVCRRKDNPAGFWALAFLFCGFIIAIAGTWLAAVVDAVHKMKL